MRTPSSTLAHATITAIGVIVLHGTAIADPGIAILEIQKVNGDAGIADQIGELLAIALSQNVEGAVEGPNELAARSSSGVRCADNECLGALARSLGYRFIVAAEEGRLGPKSLLYLRLLAVDGTTLTVVKRHSLSGATAEEAALAITKDSVRPLLTDVPGLALIDAHPTPPPIVAAVPEVMSPKASTPAPTAPAAPADRVTTEHAAISLAHGGIGLEASSKTVTRVKDPPSSVFLAGVTLGGGGVLIHSGSGSYATNAVVGLGTLGLRLRSINGKFPGAQGGILNAFDLALEVDGQAGGAAMSVPGTPNVSFNARTGQVTTTPGRSQTQFFGFGGGQAFLEATYLFTYYGAMNPQSLAQSGFGFRLGAMGGGRMNAQLSGGGSPQFSPIVGPVIGLEFPDYNAGTASLSSISFNAMVIPLPGALYAFGSLGFLF